MTESPERTTIFPFELAFRKRTEPRRRDQRGRLFMHCVIIALKPVNSQTYRLSYIETIPTERRHGYASTALSWLCQLADEYQVQLELSPLAMEDGGMKLFALTVWYQQFGFSRIGLDDEMIRYPRRAFQERANYATAN